MSDAAVLLRTAAPPPRKQKATIAGGYGCVIEGVLPAGRELTWAEGHLRLNDWHQAILLRADINRKLPNLVN